MDAPSWSRDIATGMRHGQELLPGSTSPALARLVARGDRPGGPERRTGQLHRPAPGGDVRPHVLLADRMRSLLVPTLRRGRQRPRRPPRRGGRCRCASAAACTGPSIPRRRWDAPVHLARSRQPARGGGRSTARRHLPHRHRPGTLRAPRRPTAPTPTSGTRELRRGRTGLGHAPGRPSHATRAARTSTYDAPPSKKSGSVASAADGDHTHANP